MQAIDDFEVIAVSLTVTRMDGSLLEHGAALLDSESGAWHYLTQAAAPAGETVAIRVWASDRAGNIVSKIFYSAPLH